MSEQPKLNDPSASARIYLQHYIELRRTEDTAYLWLAKLWAAIEQTINSENMEQRFTIPEGRWVARVVDQDPTHERRGGGERPVFGVTLKLQSPTASRWMEQPEELRLSAYDYRQGVSTFRGNEVLVHCCVGNAQTHKRMARHVGPTWQARRAAHTRERARSRHVLDPSSFLSEVLEEYVPMEFASSDVVTAVDALHRMSCVAFPSLWDRSDT